MRVAFLSGGRCIHCQPEWGEAIHSPGSIRGHCRRKASPAPNSSWIPHKSEGSEGENERKTEVNEYLLLSLESYKKGNGSEALSRPIPKSYFAEGHWHHQSELLLCFLECTLKKNAIKMLLLPVDIKIRLVDVIVR